MYLEKAIESAINECWAYFDEIVENHERRSYLSDYNEDYELEDFSLLEAANVLEELDKWEETDADLWQGLKPKTAIIIQAAFTFYNCVQYKFNEILKEIPDDESPALFFWSYLTYLNDPPGKDMLALALDELPNTDRLQVWFDFAEEKDLNVTEVRKYYADYSRSQELLSRSETTLEENAV